MDLAARMTKQNFSVLWLRKFLDRYPEITVKLVTHIDRQRKTAENQELFRYCLAKFFNYTIKNHIKLKYIYNLDEKSFCIGHNKCRHSIVGNGHKNLYFVQNNSQDPVKVIKSICADEHKLL